ncbi:MAG TPA: TldD/PmbA family protein, partial [Acidimicrobiales bacterium]|nr:TldD/PmbA family protein [Acidimicrobiales bacterium]
MSELLDIASKVAGWARDGEQVEAYVARSNSTSVRVFDAEIESLSTSQSEGVAVRVVRNGHMGFAYAGSLDDDVLQETLAEARDNAEFSEPDEWVGLPEPDGVPYVEMDLWRDSLAAVPTEKKIDLALQLEKELKARDPRIMVVPVAAYSDGWGEEAIASSLGISSWQRATQCVLSTYCVAVENGDTQTGFGFSVGRDHSALDLDKTVGDAAARATRLLGATKPKSRRLPVILDPMVTDDFVSVIGYPLTGEALVKGRSLFANRVGESVGSPLVTLVSDPTDTRSLAADPVDAEGLASRRVPLIDKGVLTGFVHNSYTARRTGTHSTGSAVRSMKTAPGVGCRAVTLEPGTKSQEELMADLGEGVLVLSVSGLHSGVNPVSGDFSTGAEGVVFRNGQPAEPVREFTISSTLQRMLSDVTAVGNDVE